MTNPQNHTYTIPLTPTPVQEQALDELIRQSRVVRQACVDQAMLALDGQDTSLSALLGGADHADRSAAAELWALMGLPPLATAPSGMLHHAIKDQRSRIARAGQPVTVAEPVAVAGDTLISPVTLETLQLVGVPGVLSVDAEQLPRWAASVWARTAGGQDLVPELDLSGASITGWTSIERGSYNGVDGWLIDVELRWDAWPTAQLLRGLDEETWPSSEAVRRLMDPVH
ncbi:hypothetical protein [Deinococcus marmoris]|uniref:Uncharacterized protein n=1 Tax=Deinococcus marmoris TaxID=249408 RepID=A0A1U7NWB8_9DEIO|nr:hypothetical protein [Deinococcus marmoris]OLV17223.1 hypothetical protein BOO71_0009283 [Deinococcus marmoris]OLV18716.1 hypothetical protein BOO71_0005188 [Deinococcus marmoris]